MSGARISRQSASRGSTSRAADLGAGAGERYCDESANVEVVCRFARDSPLEGGVSCELVSENAKFPASRENTGNFIDSGLGGASEAAKKDMKSVSYGPIPYAS